MVLGCLFAMLIGLTLGQDESPLGALELVSFPDPIVACAIDKSGQLIIVSTEMTVNAFNLRAQRLQWKSESNKIPATHISVGRKKAAIIFGGMSAFTHFDLKDGERTQGQGGTTAIQRATSIACDPGDKWVWIGTESGMMTRLTPGAIDGWSNRTMKNEGVTSVAMDPKGKFIAVGGKDGTLRFINAKSAKREEKMIFDGRENPVTSIAWGPKGKFIYSGDDAGRFMIHSFPSGKIKSTLDNISVPIMAIAVHPNGHMSVTSVGTGELAFWDLKEESLIKKVSVSQAGERGVLGLTFIENGDRLLGAAGSAILTWNMDDVTP